MSNLLSFENPVFKLYALAVAGTALNMIIKVNINIFPGNKIFCENAIILNY